MKTGFDLCDTTIADTFEKSGTELLNKLVEYAVINASTYAKSAGRDNLSGTDIIIALQYEAHEFLYRNNLNENTYCSDSDSDSESIGETNDDDSANEFTRSYSNDPLIEMMNYYHDTWDSWHPEIPLERVLKNAVTNAMIMYN